MPVTGCGGVASQENRIHPSPREIAEQLLQSRFHLGDVDVVTKAGLGADPSHTGLIDVDLPGMEIEDGGLLIDSVDALQHPTRGHIGQQPEISTAARWEIAV